jgi:hypothetical protein
MSKAHYASFDEYVADHPEGERFRAWLTNVRVDKRGRPVRGYEVPHSVELFRREEPTGHNELPGGYLWATIVDWTTGYWQDNPQGFKVHVNDNDDGVVIKIVSTREEAEEEMANLRLLAPFEMGDLRLFGYRPD